MLIQIPDVLTPEQVAHARRLLDAADWVDGRITAGHQAALVKDNAQLPEQHPVGRELGDIIISSLQKNALFVSAALPLRVFPPLFNRYRGGQSFGNHVDNAIRQTTNGALRIRTDLSCTLFLADPEEYDGSSHSKKYASSCRVQGDSSCLALWILMQGSIYVQDQGSSSGSDDLH